MGGPSVTHTAENIRTEDVCYNGWYLGEPAEPTGDEVDDVVDGHGERQNRLERRKQRTRAALIKAAQGFIAAGKLNVPVLTSPRPPMSAWARSTTISIARSNCSRRR